MTAVTPDAVSGGFSLRLSRRQWVLAVLVLWVALYFALRGQGTLDDGQPSDVVQRKFLEFKAKIDSGRDTNPIFVYGINNLRLLLDNTVTWVSDAIGSVGWTGPTAVAGALALIFANWKVAILAVLGFLSFGVLGSAHPVKVVSDGQLLGVVDSHQILAVIAGQPVEAQPTQTQPVVSPA